jgi:hypothetical protein
MQDKQREQFAARIAPTVAGLTKTDRKQLLKNSRMLNEIQKERPRADMKACADLFRYASEDVIGLWIDDDKCR